MILAHLYSKKTLYRKIELTGLTLTLVFAGAPASGGMQHRNAHKLRATALLELSTDQGGTTSTRLIPVTILDNNRFHDANIYERRPRPMALDNGVVYEAQKSGTPV